MTETAYATAILAQGGAAPSPWPMLIFFVLLMVGMYFLTIAPQRKQEKKRQEMIAALQHGDEVMTNGGIYGTVANIKNDRITLKVNDTVRVDFSKNSIAAKIGKEGEQVTEPEKDGKK